jgi:polyisoprenoid-binding protein YceI
MDINTFFKQIILTVTLLTGFGQLQAEEAEEVELCEPFKDGVVNESMLETMLSAAEDGHLYRIQQASSKVGFCVDSKLSRIEGDFHDFQGGIALDTGDTADGQTMVLIRAASLDTRGAFIENMLKSESFFDVENHPEILFVSNGFKWTGPESAVLKGQLTMRGITKPVIFNVTLTALDDKQVKLAEKILVKATTTINRADFGMDTLASMVNNDVQLCMSVEALKFETVSSLDATVAGQSSGPVAVPVPG